MSGGVEPSSVRAEAIPEDYHPIRPTETAAPDGSRSDHTPQRPAFPSDLGQLTALSAFL
jgi:hypothetical protein